MREAISMRREALSMREAISMVSVSTQ